MFTQKWITSQKSLLAMSKPGAERDALAAEIDAAERSNADARAKHLAQGGPGGEDTCRCIHCERWAYPGRPIVHSSRCPEADNREAQPARDLSLSLDKAERRQIDALVRG